MASVTVGAMSDSIDATDLEGLHGLILEAWNRQDAPAYAACFANDALVVGFDGSEMHGRDDIAEQLGAVFSDHEVGTYVRVVRGVRRLDERTEREVVDLPGRGARAYAVMITAHNARSTRRRAVRSGSGRTNPPVASGSAARCHPPASTTTAAFRRCAGSTGRPFARAAQRRSRS